MKQKEQNFDQITGSLIGRTSQSTLLTMRRKYFLPFLVALVLLIFSEYFFLQEVYGRSNIAILLLTGAGVAFGIIFIVSLIRKYN